MRGKDNETLLDIKLVGITPAYAGKSRYACSTVIFSLDHPRLCGEKYILRSCLFFSIGSPPPMRGKDIFFIEF